MTPKRFTVIGTISWLSIIPGWNILPMIHPVWSHGSLNMFFLITAFSIGMLAFMLAIFFSCRYKKDERATHFHRIAGMIGSIMVMIGVLVIDVCLLTDFLLPPIKTSFTRNLIGTSITLSLFVIAMGGIILVLALIAKSLHARQQLQPQQE